jgi:inhibitor of cysteine peptidase
VIEMLIDESRNGETVEIPIRDMIEIRLPENASTGYRWGMSSPCEPILAIVSDQRQPPASSARGAAGEHRWQLQAIAVGECDLEFAYRRTWESGGSPGRSFKIRVRIKA